MKKHKKSAISRAGLGQGDRERGDFGQFTLFLVEIAQQGRRREEEQDQKKVSKF